MDITIPIREEYMTEINRTKLTRDTDTLEGKLTLKDRQRIQKAWNKAILEVTKTNKQDTHKTRAKRRRKDAE